MSQPGSTENVRQNSIEEDLAQLKGAYIKLLDRQARIMELIGSTDANHLIHDIRNILNERELLRALTEIEG